MYEQPVFYIAIEDLTYRIFPQSEEELNTLITSVNSGKAVCVLGRDNEEYYRIMDFSGLPIRVG